MVLAARTIAVLGAKDTPGEAAFYVPQYMSDAGYVVVAVSPRLAPRHLWGAPSVATLAELSQPVDIINIFRRPEAIPAHIDEILALPWRPKLVWLQTGIAHPATQRLRDAGIAVVENRCLMVEHRRYLAAP